MPAVTSRHLSAQHDLPMLIHPRLGTPDYGTEHASSTANLRVMVLNYGERQPGAEDVLIRLSRPVLGQYEFDTTNGDACFSESGASLLISQPFQLIAIDALSLQAWHYHLPNRTMLMGASWQGELLIATMLGYARPMREAQTIGPLTMHEIMRDWQPGLGRV